MLRIIDKETKEFIRDDFNHDPETEIALDVEPAQGLHKPKWIGEIIEDEDGNLSIGDGDWVEGATPEEIEELTKVERSIRNVMVIRRWMNASIIY